MIGAELKIKLVPTSYNPNDVIILLKDMTGEMKELSAEQREKAIQSGVHYSEMLPQENRLSQEYLNCYNIAMLNHSREIAKQVATVAEIMLSRTFQLSMKMPIIVSLARAGIPVGILIKRYIKFKYGLDCPHYAISIIRDKGIDINALDFIYNKEIEQEKNITDNICFVDGWTGKGVIKTQLVDAVKQLKGLSNKWDNLKDDLYVLADPANYTQLCGTHDDYLLPSSCLNSTISGLISRSILNSQVNVIKGDFHGACYFKKFEDIDKSNEFIDEITKEMRKDLGKIDYELKPITGEIGMNTILDVCKRYKIGDYKKAKPGIGETTRVLLRRVPWKVLLNETASKDDIDLRHIFTLCKEKNIPIEVTKLGNYKVCGLIKELADA